MEPERENIETLERAVGSVFADLHVDEITADDLLGDNPAVQSVLPEGEALRLRFCLEESCCPSGSSGRWRR